MIVPMRMVTVICARRDTATALVELRELGVLHLLPTTMRPSQDLEATQRHCDQTQVALAALPGSAPTAAGITGRADADAVVAEVNLLSAEQREIDRRLAADVLGELSGLPPTKREER